MANRRGVFGSHFYLALLGLAAALPLLLQPGWAAAPSPTPAPPTAAPAVDPAADFETYVQPDWFSVQLPPEWQVSETSALPLVITNFAPSQDRAATPEDIHTEITWIDQPPAQVVPQALQEIQSKGYSVADYGTLTIDSMTALQLWLVDLPEAPTNAVATYIGYENGTAVITSRFGTATPEVEAVLTAVHRSFSRL